ncbi:hypothetical protein RHODO2019_07675 [Rhodococcus antarcticus]|uniref:Uncharacterized protein n=1 Tax=Rhodococcus antarcticus TaxID=2987751 RepID=A0ABY6P5B7_9NOCA|nr:hypothetical protein [Rhodococcus antarcticus]UZJ26273.1 hypothetical protein RHODO2019_07675 [Rhodococcus antarcticus]
MRNSQRVSCAPVPEQWLTPDGCYLLPMGPDGPNHGDWIDAWDATVEGRDAEAPDEGC